MLGAVCPDSRRVIDQLRRLDTRPELVGRRYAEPTGVAGAPQYDEVTKGSAVLTVSGGLRLLALCVVLATAMLAPLAQATPNWTDAPPGGSRDCEELVPESYSASGVTDSGQPVSLDVLVFLDGTSLRDARGIMETAATAYAPLNIRLKAVRYRTLAIPADGKANGEPTAEIDRVFATLKDAVGGERPTGVDSVLLLTSKVLWMPTPDGGRLYGIGGVADCIGGVRYPEYGFAISAGTRENRPVPRAARTAAHELGHVMGAAHHYANCVEGAAPEMCTVMFNADLEGFGLKVNSLKFSTAEAVVVRGHAVDFAAP